jgi:hypothetical protein
MKAIDQRRGGMRFEDPAHLFTVNKILPKIYFYRIEMINLQAGFCSLVKFKDYFKT